jgi:lipopolysaccharide/colanic/teichoic acid biosynthesis glycosyltransferase
MGAKKDDMKRLFDIFCSGIALLALAPFLVAIYLAVKVSSPGPGIYRQIRVGLNGQTFPMYKFRSMVVGADLSGGYQTAPRDPRITQIGGWLRRTSLDELPQLLNVLLGHMSIVGPRPDVSPQVALYSKQDNISRHAVRPGITGLAQATLRSDATAKQRLKLDLEYAKRPSFLTDLKILVLTARQIWLKGGH